jgi:radical SAM superfamily enzyme YgiQ (UPF0313 family)
MYKGVRFALAPMDEIEADLREIAATTPHARTIQLLSANPLVLSYDKMAPILEKIRAYLPEMECVYAAGRVTDIRNKTVGQLRKLRDMGLREISMGTESGDDWTLDRVSKGYHAQDIVEQCAKLDEAHIRYWHTFLNGVAGRSHSREHAMNSARVFSQTHPMVVGTGGLTLFPGTPLLDEAQAGEFDPLSEREMLEELLLFVENLDVDCSFITHHTIGGANLTGPDFLGRKAEIAAALRDELEHGDLSRMAALRRSKRTL